MNFVHLLPLFTLRIIHTEIDREGGQYYLTQTRTTCIVFVSMDFDVQIFISLGFTENSARDYLLKTEQENVGGRERFRKLQ